MSARDGSDWKVGRTSTANHSGSHRVMGRRGEVDWRVEVEQLLREGTRTGGAGLASGLAEGCTEGLVGSLSSLEGARRVGKQEQSRSRPCLLPVHFNRFNLPLSTHARSHRYYESLNYPPS